MSWQDLEQQLTEWFVAGDRVALFLDANKNLKKGKLQHILKKLGMHDAIKYRAKIPGPATWYRGKWQIDGVFLLRGLECSKARFLPLWSGIGNHQPIVLDIPHQVLYGEQNLQIVWPLSRRLQYGQEKSMTKYIQYLMKYFKLHKIDAKLQIMCKDMRLLSKKEFGDRSEAIDSIKTECILAAENLCRKFRAGTVYYSPDVIKRKKKGYVWSLVVKNLEGKVINTAYICRLAYQVEISSPLLVSLEEAKH